MGMFWHEMLVDQLACFIICVDKSLASNDGKCEPIYLFTP